MAKKVQSKEVDGMSPWWYQGLVIGPESVPEWAVAMVYKIVRVGDGESRKPKIYIGKKMLTSTRKKKIGKKAIAAERASRADGKAKTVERVTKDSGWGTYWSSCKELQQEQKEYPEWFHREVIEWCYSKKNATYLELKYQFKYSVLENDTYNANINGSLYKHDTDRKLYEQFRERQRNRKQTNETT